MDEAHSYSGDDILHLTPVESIRRSPLDSYLRNQPCPIACLLQEAVCLAYRTGGDNNTIVITVKNDSSFSVWVDACLPPFADGQSTPLFEDVLCRDAFGCVHRHPSCAGEIVLTNALSEWLVVEVADGTNAWEQRYAYGRPQQPISIVSTTTEIWQRISFLPDFSLLPKPFDREVFRQWFDFDKCYKPSYTQFDPPCDMFHDRISLVDELTGTTENLVLGRR